MKPDWNPQSCEIHQVKKKDILLFQSAREANVSLRNSRYKKSNTEKTTIYNGPLQSLKSHLFTMCINSRIESKNEELRREKRVGRETGQRAQQNIDLPTNKGGGIGKSV